MAAHADTAFRGIDEDAALRAILEGTASATGERFFPALVDALARALHTEGAWVTEYLPHERRLRALAFRMGDEWVEDYEYAIEGTPCEEVVAGRRLVRVPADVVRLYPRDRDLVDRGAVSFMGAPLLDPDGNVIGHLAVIDGSPLPDEPRYPALLRVFAARAAAELERLHAEARVREREAQLRLLVDSAMDAILEIDADLRLRLVNPAAETAFGLAAADTAGRDFGELLSAASRERLVGLVRELDARAAGGAGDEGRGAAAGVAGIGRGDGGVPAARARGSLWIPGGLEARRSDGTSFPAEGSLSRAERGGRARYTLILRNVNERLEAEARIRALRDEAEYLREELRAAGSFGDILGGSEAVRGVLRAIAQVAPTDATVLVEGETGTGKELVARAIHAASRRRAEPLVRVNCAAIPKELIESEFFGHERGAFTGATARREGRFALADGGTIFLDEVGELPLDLQAKLLRVLQEGEFEPVGSARTRRVDVRVVAATNRDLERAARRGSFREDLYYRLAVFPVRVPPLRERLEDVPVLAAAFTERVARRMGRRAEPLTADDVRRLTAYEWPGNVRELQNVIERGLIVSPDGRVDLAQALPAAAAERRGGARADAGAGATAGAVVAGGAVGAPAASAPGSGAAAAGVETAIADAASGPDSAARLDRIHTAAELRELERENLVRALEAARWKVSGRDGAASLLGMKPSTLASRMKALGLRSPR